MIRSSAVRSYFSFIVARP